MTRSSLKMTNLFFLGGISNLAHKKIPKNSPPKNACHHDV